MFFFQDNLLNRIEGQEQELAATQEEEVGKLRSWSMNRSWSTELKAVE